MIVEEVNENETRSKDRLRRREGELRFEYVLLQSPLSVFLLLLVFERDARPVVESVENGGDFSPGQLHLIPHLQTRFFVLGCDV